jgi:hypothetical protein
MPSVAEAADGRLTLAIQDSAWIMRNDEGWLRGRRYPPARRSLLAEHGQLMHLFVVDAEKGGAFAHLHPETIDSVNFTAAMPPLPAGRYTVFADLVERNGFAQTAVATLEWAGPGDSLLYARTASDDGWTAEPPRPWGGPPADRAVPLGDGSELRWKTPEKPILAGEEAGLRFAIEGPADLPPLEPYLGMTGHAVVVRDDGKVFIHLHPMGTVSPAATAAFAEQQRKYSCGQRPNADGIALEVMCVEASPMDVHGLATGAEAGSAPDASSTLLYFPYAFPEPGTYHVWVQVKRAGRVLTAGFDAVVKAPTP